MSLRNIMLFLSPFLMVALIAVIGVAFGFGAVVATLVALITVILCGGVGYAIVLELGD